MTELRWILLFVLIGGLSLLYSSCGLRVGDNVGMGIDQLWWDNLSEEWKTIFLINQKFSERGVNVFELQKHYANRLNDTGEESNSEMNKSLHDLDELNTFSLGYKEMYARAIRENLIDSYDTIDLKTLSNLTTIYMVNGPGDLSPLKYLSELRTLIINSCGNGYNIPEDDQELDLEPLRNLYELRVLHCSSKSLRSLYPIKHLMSLEELECTSSMNVLNLNRLKLMKGLRRLRIGSNFIGLDAIAGFANLESLSIGSIKNTAPIESLKKLKRLSIGESELSIVDPAYRISDIHFLSGLTDLEYLDLEYTSYRGSLLCLNNLIHLKAVMLPLVSYNDFLIFSLTKKQCKIINKYQFER